MPKFKLIDNSIVFIEDKNVEEFLSQNPGAVQVSAVEENAMKNDGSYYKMLEQETGRRVGDVNAISGRAKIFHIAPTTFHGIKRGIDIKTKQTGTPIPSFGIVSAIAIPKGIWINKIINVNKNCLPNDA